MSAVLEPPTVILSRKLPKRCLSILKFKKKNTQSSLIQIGLKSLSKPEKRKFTKAN